MKLSIFNFTQSDREVPWDLINKALLERILYIILKNKNKTE